MMSSSKSNNPDQNLDRHPTDLLRFLDLPAALREMPDQKSTISHQVVNRGVRPREAPHWPDDKKKHAKWNSGKGL